MKKPQAIDFKMNTKPPKAQGNGETAAILLAMIKDIGKKYPQALLPRAENDMPMGEDYFKDRI
jgi:hypothetical protein